MGNFSGSDSLDIAKALSTSNKKLDEESARSLGRNVPKTANAKDLLSLASSIPIECFNQTSASDLVNNLGKMDLDNMDSFRKTFIAKNVIKNKFSFYRHVRNSSISFLMAFLDHGKGKQGRSNKISNRQQRSRHAQSSYFKDY